MTVSRRGILTIAGIVIIMAIATLYYLVDPASAEWIPKCPLKALTGLDCPGCGSQRMIHALLHGDMTGALEANAALLILLPLLIFMGGVEMWRTHWPRLHSVLFSTWMSIGLGAVIIFWFIWRNL